MNGFEMTLLVKRTSESGEISNIFEQAINALVIELGRGNVTFWLTSWTWFICALIKMLNECI